MTGVAIVTRWVGLRFIRVVGMFLTSRVRAKMHMQHLQRTCAEETEPAQAKNNESFVEAILHERTTPAPHEGQSPSVRTVVYMK